MNQYEVMYVIDTALEEQARTDLINRFSGLVELNGGQVDRVDEWGKRRLAYAINYKTEGYYVLMYIAAPAELPRELERNFQINENVLRYMVIRYEGALPPKREPLKPYTPHTEAAAPAAEAEAPAPEVVPPAAPETPSMPVPPVFRLPVENDEPVPEPDPEIVPEAEDEPDITVEFIEAEDDNVPEPEDEMPVPPVPTEFPEVDESPVSSMRVDEKLQRSISKDIRKAFSVNDRFRFQRELFAGSASAMNTAIEHIEMMRSYGNAELYFYSQLHWDRDNEEVKDFMAIVRNHFQK